MSKVVEAKMVLQLQLVSENRTLMLISAPTYPLNGASSPPSPSRNEYTYSAPPPLSIIPSRQASDSSQVILTPDELAARQEAARIVQPLDEPAVDPSLSGTNDQDGYFEGVVGIRRDGTALIEKDESYDQYASSPGQVYNRELMSPMKSSPSYHQARSFSPIGQDSKPVFAMPFPPQSYSMQQGEGMLAPPLHSHDMEEQGSGDDENQNWQPSRW